MAANAEEVVPSQGAPIKVAMMGLATPPFVAERAVCWKAECASRR